MTDRVTVPLGLLLITLVASFLIALIVMAGPVR